MGNIEDLIKELTEKYHDLSFKMDIEQKKFFLFRNKSLMCNTLGRQEEILCVINKLLLLREIKVGDHIKTSEEFYKKMYEPLYHEKILDGKVLNIDKNNVVTYELIKSSCDFSKPFNYHMNTWKEGSVHEIGLGWIELKD